MNLIIIAAGRGSRLKPLTNQVHKSLLILNGKPLLEHALDSASNFERVLIVVGYKANDFEYLTNKYKNVELVYSKKWESTNTHESIKVAFNKLKKNAYIMNADNMINLHKIKREMKNTTIFYSYKRNSFEWTMPLFGKELFSFSGKGFRALMEIYFVLYSDFLKVAEKQQNFLMNLALSDVVDVSVRHLSSSVSAGDVDSPFDLKKFSHDYETKFEIENTIIGFIVRIAGIDSKDIKIIEITDGNIMAKVKGQKLIFRIAYDLRSFYAENKDVFKGIRG